MVYLIQYNQRTPGDVVYLNDYSAIGFWLIIGLIYLAIYLYDKSKNRKKSSSTRQSKNEDSVSPEGLKYLILSSLGRKDEVGTINDKEMELLDNIASEISFFLCKKNLTDLNSIILSAYINTIFFYSYSHSAKDLHDMIITTTNWEYNTLFKWYEKESNVDMVLYEVTKFSLKENLFECNQRKLRELKKIYLSNM